MSLSVPIGKILEAYLVNKEKSVFSTCVKIMAKRRQLGLAFREMQHRPEVES